MQRTKAANFSLLFAFACILSADESAIYAQSIDVRSSIIDGHSFITTSLVAGKPDFAAIKKGFPAESQYGTVRLGDSLGTIFVYCGKDSVGQWHYFLFHHRLAGDWTRDWLDFGQNVQETLRTTITLRPGNKQASFPIEIRLAIPKHEMYFRWLLSPQYPGTPGGVPTPADVALCVGKPIPVFRVADLLGKRVLSSELIGRITVINWWATWCLGCRQEIAGFNKLVKKYESSVDFVAIAINTPKELKRFLAVSPFDFRHLVASDSMFRFLGSAIPRTVILNKAGIVSFDKEGGGTNTYQEVQDGIESLIRN